MRIHQTIAWGIVLLFMVTGARADDIAQQKAVEQPSAVEEEPKLVCFKSQCYQVEIADTCITRAKGLQLRESLPADRGMLFVFQSVEPRAIWMKDTLIPLDIIWLDEDRRVVAIEKNVPPCTQEPCAVYRPNAATRFVLEINAGQVQDLSLSLGSRMNFNWEPEPIHKGCQVRER